MTKETLGCADCRAKSCHLGDGRYPAFCPGQTLSEEVVKDAMKEYEKPEVQRVAIAAAETESENIVFYIPQLALLLAEKRLAITFMFQQVSKV